MVPYDSGSFCEGSGECHLSPEKKEGETRPKPIEIYAFIDPICPECWGLEPVLKKLQVAFGHYFHIRYVLGGQLDALNDYQKKLRNKTLSAKDLAAEWEKFARASGMSCDGDLWHENPLSSPYRTALAIKAAEMQGKKAGIRFLRKIREELFLHKRDVTNEDVLIDCAREIGLDFEEFRRDMCSEGAVNAFRCDVKITAEMEIDEFPSLVFLHEEEGIKIAGFYGYDTYVHILSELLGKTPESREPPPLEQFLKKHPFVATQELAAVYDWRAAEVDRKMKPLVLQQTVEKVPVKYGTFWRYLNAR